MLPVFTALFGLRAAVPMLTLTQLSSNASRLGLNRRHVRWPLVGWFAAGAVPFAVAGGLLLTHAPLSSLNCGMKSPFASVQFCVDELMLGVIGLLRAANAVADCATYRFSVAFTAVLPVPNRS